MVSRSTRRRHSPRSRCWTRKRLPESQARPEGAGLETHRSAIDALLLGRSGRRRLVVVLGFRIEELAGCGERLGGGVLIFLTGRDVLAAVDALGFVGAARHGDADADFDFRMYGDGDLMLADSLYRRIEQDLAAADGDTVGLEGSDDVAHADRAEQLAGLRGLTQHDHVAAVCL